MTTYQSKDLIGWITWHYQAGSCTCAPTTPYYQLPQCYTSYTIHLYYYTELHYTSLLLHGATPYISIATRSYTIHLYCYTELHHTSLLLHRATPYISITTQCYTIHSRVLYRNLASSPGPFFRGRRRKGLVHTVCACVIFPVNTGNS